MHRNWPLRQSFPLFATLHHANHCYGITVANREDKIEGNWKQFKGKAKQQWGKLTDDELDIAEGKRDELAGRIQERYGISKDEAHRQIDDWTHRL